MVLLRRCGDALVKYVLFILFYRKCPLLKKWSLFYMETSWLFVGIFSPTAGGNRSVRVMRMALRDPILKGINTPQELSTWLTHWSPGDLNDIWDETFSSFNAWWLRYILWNCPQMYATWLYWWKGNIGSGNGLVPDGTKPLPEPVFTQIYVAIWRH